MVAPAKFFMKKEIGWLCTENFRICLGKGPKPPNLWILTPNPNWGFPEIDDTYRPLKVAS
jgi:hypothetical protein